MKRQQDKDKSIICSRNFWDQKKTVKAFKDEQAHKNMLNKEEAKLKDEDMKKVHMRAKRLEMRKKDEIISKAKRN